MPAQTNFTPHVNDSRHPHLRHTALNFAGIVIPLIAGIAVMPVLVRELGPARFGLLSLAWAVLEYFTLFDAGLGRATTRAVAERLAAQVRIDDLSDLVASSLIAQTALGLLGGVVLALLSPFAASVVPGASAQLATEVRTSLVVLAAMLPFLLLGLALRGLLEAAARFELSNALRAPTSTATFVVPALAASTGASLPEIFVWLLLARVASCVGGIWLVRRAIPSLRWQRPRSWMPLRAIAAFGGWVSVSNLLSPLLLLFDRFALGAIAGLAAVGFYTGPYEATTRLLLIPASLLVTVFPAAGAHAAHGEIGELRSLYRGALRGLTVAMLGGTLFGVVFAHSLLDLWLGPEIAAMGADAFRILLCAVFIISLAHVPFGFVQAMGRPDLTARFHLLELVVHIPLTLLLVSRWGITGAALSWLARVVLDSALLFGAATRMLDFSPSRIFAGRWALLATVTAGVTLLLVAAERSLDDMAVAAVLIAAAAAVYAVSAWFGLLTSAERGALGGVLRRS